jgi:hypothetical protein
MTYVLYIICCVDMDTTHHLGRKLERARDLFEQVLVAAPVQSACCFYERYAKLEEAHGLWRNAVRIYERGTTALTGTDQVRISM